MVKLYFLFELKRIIDMIFSTYDHNNFIYNDSTDNNFYCDNF